MEEYVSKQVRIRRPAATVYGMLSEFSNFTPILKDKVEEWEASPDTCSFKLKGFAMNLRVVGREQNEMVKIAAEEGSPLDFAFWMQLKEVAPDDTRMRLVMHVKLNMMMKMMLGKKLETGIDQIAEQIAGAFK